MIIELGIIQQDMVGAGGGHHNERRDILKEMWGHQVSKCKYCKAGGINGRDRGTSDNNRYFSPNSYKSIPAFLSPLLLCDFG